MGPIVAQRDGRCLACDEPIIADVDKIVKTDDDEWVHAECAEDA